MASTAIQNFVGIDSNVLSDEEFAQLLQTAWRADLDCLIIATANPGKREAEALAATQAEGRVAELVSQRGDVKQAVTWLALRAPAVA
ncbi:hypothetical protein [Cupriavidus pampae]|uniref:Uncharacterized protein n=1 Tax=Cupriavidus pampae TaxID=659251 RepID=A0ABM8XU00_9BURK|nr:hypothetical protein [Cupriavidus pampae]CAG9183796.1 hypothetical protein LMG32289_05423 [Cupriavidus pampae]